MLDLQIDSLNLNFENATGQEHRIRPIATQALTILSDRLGERWAVKERMPDTQNLESLSVPPVNLMLQQMSDDQAAEAITQAILEELILKLGI
jgi:hypothetical protein